MTRTSIPNFKLFKDNNYNRSSYCIKSLDRFQDIVSVSLLSDFPKDLIYVPCGISQDWIVRLPSLNALHNKREDSKVPNVYFSEPSI